MFNINKYFRTIKILLLLVKNFTNWNDILKRVLRGYGIYSLSSRSGIKIRGSKNDNLLRLWNEIFIDNSYRISNMSIKETDIILDIGANIGLFSINVSQYTKNKIFALEPHPENFTQLKDNVKLNGIKNVACINLGLQGENDGSRYFLNNSNHAGFIMENALTEKNIGSVRTSEKLSLACITFQELCNTHAINKVNLLKLDCEGAEGEIIKSLSKHDMDIIEKFVIEFHDNVSILDHDEIITILIDNNFGCELKWDGQSNFGYIYAQKI